MKVYVTVTYHKEEVYSTYQTNRLGGLNKNKTTEHSIINPWSFTFLYDGTDVHSESLKRAKKDCDKRHEKFVKDFISSNGTSVGFKSISYTIKGPVTFQAKPLQDMKINELAQILTLKQLKELWEEL